MPSALLNFIMCSRSAMLDNFEPLVRTPSPLLSPPLADAHAHHDEGAARRRGGGEPGRGRRHTQEQGRTGERKKGELQFCAGVGVENFFYKNICSFLKSQNLRCAKKSSESLFHNEMPYKALMVIQYICMWFPGPTLCCQILSAQYYSWKPSTHYVFFLLAINVSAPTFKSRY